MSRDGVIAAFLVAALAALIGAHWLFLPDPSRRNWRVLPGMVDSVALEAQAPPPSFEAGLALDLRLPEGSVVRGYPPFPYAAGEAGAAAAARELVNPVAPDDAAAVARGRAVFGTYCAVCHGAGGDGDGSVTRRGVPPPPSLFGANAMSMTDGRMYHIITRGQGNMAAYASQVEREDRWKVIRYVRSLQDNRSSAQIASTSTPPETP